MNIGDVYRLKTSGENVTYIGPAEGEKIKIRRAIMTRDGFTHFIDSVYAAEVESVKDNIQREFDEMVFKNDLLRDYNKKNNTDVDEDIFAEGGILQ